MVVTTKKLGFIDPKTGSFVAGSKPPEVQVSADKIGFLDASGRFVASPAPTPTPAPAPIVPTPIVQPQPQDLLTRAGVTAPIGSAEATAQLLAKGQALITPKDIEPIIDVKDLALGDVGDVKTPLGDTQANTVGYITGLTQDLATKQKTLTDLYDKQLKDIREKESDLKTKISEFETKQEGIITGEVKDLLKPFRADLEKTERQRLKIEENFFANQQSVNELQTLLTQATADISSAEAVTGLASIRNPRIAKIKEDMSARVGIIEAVMASRNNQIVVAENMIDRSISVIEADRKDQLTYYQTILNFIETKKDTAGNKLITLEKDEKDFVTKQINLLESDLATSKASVDFIKGLMLDPETASIVELSGVKLTDSITEIQAKFSEYSYRKERTDINNSMQIEGFELLALPSMTVGKSEEELTRITDSRGNEMVFWKKAEVVEPDTQIIEADGRKLLINKATGETIRDLGAVDITGGRDLPATQVVLLSDAKIIPSFLDDLEKIIEENKGLFFTGSGLIPFSEKRAKIDDDLRRTAQIVGRFMEGGVLRKEDEIKYRAMLPQLSDLNSTVALDKLKGVREMLGKKYNEYLKDFQASGFNVSGFEPINFGKDIPTEFNLEIDDIINIFSDIPVESGGSTDPFGIR